jgi:PAS domain S-box-containing protein
MHETERASLATGLSTDFASSGAAVVVMRSDGTFLYVGEGFCELVGRTRAELVGLRADETGIASSAGRTRWILDRASEVGAAFAYRRLYPTAAGDRLVNVNVHRAAEDLIVTTLTDISERENGADEAELVGPFVDAVPAGLVVYDRALRVAHALPDVDPQVAAAVEAVLESGEHIVSLAVPRPDGHGLLLNVFPIRDAGDAVVQVGCLYSDAELTGAHATPILELDDRVLVAPLVGEMDTGRVRQLTGRLLQAITDTRARLVIFDVTGVPAIDSVLAHELMSTVAVARLLGAQAVMSGISADHAEAITRLGVALTGFDTVATLAEAVALARSQPLRAPVLS